MKVKVCPPSDISECGLQAARLAVCKNPPATFLKCALQQKPASDFPGGLLAFSVDSFSVSSCNHAGTPYAGRIRDRRGSGVDFRVTKLSLFTYPLASSAQRKFRERIGSRDAPGRAGFEYSC